jgi:hypothetical protein
MFGAETLMGQQKRERLERSWAHQYRLQALPLIDETKFAKYFDEGNGRPRGARAAGVECGVAVRHRR